MVTEQLCDECRPYVVERNGVLVWGNGAPFAPCTDCTTTESAEWVIPHHESTTYVLPRTDWPPVGTVVIWSYKGYEYHRHHH